MVNFDISCIVFARKDILKSKTPHPPVRRRLLVNSLGQIDPVRSFICAKSRSFTFASKKLLVYTEFHWSMQTGIVHQRWSNFSLNAAWLNTFALDFPLLPWAVNDRNNMEFWTVSHGWLKLHATIEKLSWLCQFAFRKKTTNYKVWSMKDIAWISALFASSQKEKKRKAMAALERS